MNCKILVGEDDFEDQLILEDYFRDNGLYDGVSFATNGKKVIEFLEKINPETDLPRLVILDLNMPILNGTQALYQIKQHPRFSSIPVIIYSTSNNEHEKRKCLSFGAEDYLVKPMTFDEGHEIVRRFIEYLK